MQQQVQKGITGRKSFGQELRPEVFSVFLNSSSDVQDPKNTKLIASLLNNFGVALIEFREEETPREQLLCFKEFLGDVMFHDRADEYGIAEVTVIDNLSVYPGISSRAYTFHTDGSYDDIPPKIIALRCQISAASGGITQLASGKRLFNWLQSEHPEVFNVLFDENVLTIKRGKKYFSGSIFQEISKNRFSIRYRADDAVINSQDVKITRAKKLIEEFLSKKENLIEFQLTERQVLLTDNLSVLHGRTAFDAGDPRKLHRLWFNGKVSICNPEIYTGFEINPKI